MPLEVLRSTVQFLLFFPIYRGKQNIVCYLECVVVNKLLQFIFANITHANGNYVDSTVHSGLSSAYSKHLLCDSDFEI